MGVGQAARSLWSDAHCFPCGRGSCSCKANLADEFTFSAPDRIRPSRLLGRCHAAGASTRCLSTSAFDAALRLAKTGPYLMHEAMAVRGRVLAGRGASVSVSGAAGAADADAAGQWDEYVEQYL